MIESTFFKTDNDNYYLYDDESRLVLYIHPELAKAEQGKSEDKYYIQKHDYLKSKGLIKSHQNIHFSTINSNLIKDSISQTKQIVFEVTDKCNLKCIYCIYGDLYDIPTARNIHEINFKDASALLKFIINQKADDDDSEFFISFFGGEPLMNIKFIKKIISLARRLCGHKKLKLKFSMTTNSVLLLKHANFLINNDFKLLISLDGNKENDSYRISKNNNCSFDLVIRNLDYIKDRFPLFFENNISFNAVLHDKNSIKDIYEFIYKKYRKIPRIAELSLDNPREGKEEKLRKMHKYINAKDYDSLKMNKDIYNLSQYESPRYHNIMNFLNYNSVNYYISNINLIIQDRDIYFPTDTCLPFSRKIFMTVQGKIMPCEKITTDNLLGTVNNNVLIDTDFIASQYNILYEIMSKQCSNCYSYRICGKCLFKITKFSNTKKNISCDSFCSKETFSSKLNKIFSTLESNRKYLFQIAETPILI